ncbi:hypothetical protein LIA77_07330 [Sarocladium implicatum]|nr:hypothetical protein LIA77_07330 [Sarocladium implicatum]
MRPCPTRQSRELVERQNRQTSRIECLSQISQVTIILRGDRYQPIASRDSGSETKESAFPHASSNSKAPCCDASSSQLEGPFARSLRIRRRANRKREDDMSPTNFRLSMLRLTSYRFEILSRQSQTNDGTVTPTCPPLDILARCSIFFSVPSSQRGTPCRLWVSTSGNVGRKCRLDRRHQRTLASCHAWAERGA